MLKESRAVSFVPAADLDRAQAFYEAVLGLEFLHDAKFARVFGIGETTLRITHVEGLKPQPFTILGWEVESLTEALNELRSHGVESERYEGLEQTEHGIWTAPSGDLVAWFKDSEGNALSLTQRPAASRPLAVRD